MNTQIYLWLEPLAIGHQRCNDKVYFTCVVKEDYTTLELKDVEEKLGNDRVISSIMDFADIRENWNYGVVSTTSTKKEPVIAYAVSPEKAKEKKEEKQTAVKVIRALKSDVPFVLDNKTVVIQDNGVISVSLPALKVNQELDFKKVWDALESHVKGHIKEGDRVTLTDDDGNVLMEITGGSFLNVGLADMKVYDAAKRGDATGWLNEVGLKAGVFVRNDGSLDIGDVDRTFYMKVYTNQLLKASMKAGKTLNELTRTKLLK